MATDDDDLRHDAEYGDSICGEPGCWCETLCWEANFSGDCIGTDLPDDDDLALLVIVRGLQEALSDREAPR